MPPKRVSFSDRLNATAAAAPAGPRPDPAIFGNTADQQVVLDLPINQIMPNLSQPRKHFDEAALDELADSIREQGVISPIIVRPLKAVKTWEGSPRRYEIIAGERRWRASTRAEKDAIPTIVLESVRDQGRVMVMALTENLQRENLNPLEEGLAFRQLHEDLGMSYAEIGKQVGKAKSYVQKRMELTEMPEDLQALVRERADAMTHASVLTQLPEPEQRAPLIEGVRNKDLSVHELRQLVQEILNPDDASSPAPEDERSSAGEDRASAGEDRASAPQGEQPPFDAKKRMNQAARAIAEIREHLDFLDERTQAAIMGPVGELIGDLEQIMTKLSGP